MNGDKPIPDAAKFDTGFSLPVDYSELSLLTDSHARLQDYHKRLHDFAQNTLKDHQVQLDSYHNILRGKTEQVLDKANDKLEKYKDKLNIHATEVLSDHLLKAYNYGIQPPEVGPDNKIIVPNYGGPMVPVSCGPYPPFIPEPFQPEVQGQPNISIWFNTKRCQYCMTGYAGSPLNWIGLGEVSGGYDFFTVQIPWVLQHIPPNWTDACGNAPIPPSPTITCKDPFLTDEQYKGMNINVLQTEVDGTGRTFKVMNVADMNKPVIGQFLFGAAQKFGDFSSYYPFLCTTFQNEDYQFRAIAIVYGGPFDTLSSCEGCKGAEPCGTIDNPCPPPPPPPTPVDCCQASCPAPVINITVPCGDKTPTPETEYQLWQTTESDCYCQDSKDDPRSTDDVSKGVFKNSEDCETAKALCQPPSSGGDLIPIEEDDALPINLIPIQLPDLADKDFCTKLRALEAVFLSVGSEVIAAQAEGNPAPYFAKSIIYTIQDKYGDERSGATATNKSYDAWFDGVNLQEIWSQYVDSITSVLGTSGPDLVKLLAARAIYHLGADFEMGLNYHFQDQSTTDLKTKTGIGIGGGLSFFTKLIDIGIKFGVETSYDRMNRYGTDTGFHTKLKLIFLPALEIIDHIIRAKLGSEVPKPADAIRLWKRNTITEGTCICLLQFSGLNNEFILPLMNSEREKLTPNEIIRFARRQGWEEKEATLWIHDQLRLIGFTGEYDRSVLIEQSYNLATPADLLHWTQRNVFDKDYVRDFQLDQNFEEVFWKNFGPYFIAASIPKEIAFNHYTAHWILPSPEQLKVFLQRLTPDKVTIFIEEQTGKPQDSWGPSEQSLFDELVFSQDRFLRSLAEQDVAPSFRKRFLATLYHPLSTRLIKQLYDGGTYSQNDLANILTDLGYSPKDAEKGAASFEYQRRRDIAKSAYGYQVSDVISLFKDGIITEENVAARLLYFGFTEEDAQEAIEHANLEVDHGLLKERVKVIEKCYVDGRINRESAFSELELRGIDAGRLADLLDLWDLKKACDQKRPSITEITKSLKDGIISPEVAAQILLAENLTPDRVSIIIANVVHDIYARQIASEQKSAKEQAKMREKLARAFAKQIKAQLKREKKLDEIRLSVSRALATAEKNLNLASIRESAILAKAQTTDKVEKARIQAEAIQETAQIQAQEHVEQAEQQAEVKSEEPI